MKRFFVFGLALLITGAAASLVAIFLFAKDLPSPEQITARQVSQSTKIYDREGEVLLYEISAGEKRTVVPFEEIPQSLKDATIAIEDERFYEEPAFDWRGYLRALLVNLRHGEIRQGGSTITIQLARNAFLAPDQTITRKLKEFILAIQLARHYPKDQILGLYLNEVPYGPTLYGVEAASRSYFNKSAKDLTLGESALLAALPKAPSYYSPWGTHLKELLGRQRLVLQKMFGLGKISESELGAALAAKMSFAPQSDGLKAPHFVIAVQEYLIQRYGEDLVRRGGLRVITTLDWKLQELAEGVVSEGAERNEKLYKGKNAALVAEDPKTGQVLALVGSRNYFDTEQEGNFDVASQGLRQPGSALKPFAYLTAFQKKFTPETIVFDLPTEFAANDPRCPAIPNFDDDQPACFHPENFDGVFRGPVSLRQALAQSINVPAVKVLYLAGLRNVVENASRLGLRTLTNPDIYGLSLVLGGGAVRLVDLVGAYSVLAADGVKHRRSMLLEVKDGQGKILESYRDESERVADVQSVRLVNDILSDSRARTGLFQGSLSLTVFPEHDVALKTGTSDDYRDAWALGYTPGLAVGVWAGNNDNSPMQRQGSSILAAVPIWHAFMDKALGGRSPEVFGRPEPTAPQKPILAGDYLANNQIHSILYYVDRRDPAGLPPTSPSDDSQFPNWETSVLAWAATNLPNFKNLNQTSTAPYGSDRGSVSVKILEPQSGSFVGGEVFVRSFVAATNNLSLLRVYFNGGLVQEFNLAPRRVYDFSWSFVPPLIEPQNLLEIEAVDEKSLSGRERAIVYHK